MNSDDLTDYENHLSRYRGNFRDFVLYGLNSPEVLSQIHFRPQVEWIRSQDGALIPDFIGKTETLDDSMRSLAKLLGVDHTPVSIRNQSAHQDYRDYYNDKMIDLVASAYAEDVDTFGYAFDRKLSRQSEFSN